MVLKGSRIVRMAVLVALVIVLGSLARGWFPGLGLPGGGGRSEDAVPAEKGFTEGSLSIEGAPAAVAVLQGGPLAPELGGEVLFFAAGTGTVVAVRVKGLPEYMPAAGDQQPVGPHGFHIHEFGTCEVGDPQDPFLAAGDHWNPTGEPHGDHPGDFPVLFSNLGAQGTGVMTFFTDEFQPADAVGLSVLIHLHPDDYRTQPAGASGPRLACGVIEAAG